MCNIVWSAAYFFEHFMSVDLHKITVEKSHQFRGCFLPVHYFEFICVFVVKICNFHRCKEIRIMCLSAGLENAIVSDASAS